MLSILATVWPGHIFHKIMPIINYAIAPPVTASEITVWMPLFSAAMASGVTILGIWLNNHFARQSKTEERAIAIKKEIFLEFADYVSNAMTLLQAICNTENDLKEILARYNETTGIIGKMYLVAEPSLLLQVRAVVSEFETCGSEMVALRQGMRNMQTKVENIREMRSETSKVLDDLTSHHLGIIRTGEIPSPKVQLAIDWERNFTTKRLQDLTDQLFAAETQVYNASLDLYRLGVKCGEIVEEKTLKPLLEMKTQLGIPHDAKIYEAAVRAENKKRRDALEQLVAARSAPTETPMPIPPEAI